MSIADLPIFATLGVRGPAMVLGLDCLAAPKAGANYGARVVLSARDGLVWLEALAGAILWHGTHTRRSAV